MSTAHRPTWHAAKASSSVQGAFKSAVVHSRDLDGQLSLKERAGGTIVTNSKEARELLKARLLLEEREGDVSRANRAQITPLEVQGRAQVSNDPSLVAKRRKLYESLDGFENPNEEDEDDDAIFRRTSNDSSDSEASSDTDSNSDSSDVNSEDEEAALMRELEKIKAERRAEETKKEEEANRVKKEEELAAVAKASASTTTLTRRWDDDTVFKNQARTQAQVKQGKQFVNDVVRSEFHRKFMGKYIH